MSSTGYAAERGFEAVGRTWLCPNAPANIVETRAVEQNHKIQRATLKTDANDTHKGATPIPSVL